MIWLVDPAAAGEAGLDAALARLGASRLCSSRPGRVGARERPLASLAPIAPPARPPQSLPVVLVLRAGDALAGGADRRGWRPDGGAIARGGRAGSRREVSRAAPTDGSSASTSTFRFAPAGARALRGARRARSAAALPPGRSSRSPCAPCRRRAEDRKKLAPLFDAADALVAFVFGAGPRVDPSRSTRCGGRGGRPTTRGRRGFVVGRRARRAGACPARSSTRSPAIRASSSRTTCPSTTRASRPSR